MTTIVFDVDDTLIDTYDQPRWDVVEALRFFARQKECQVFVHSGGGQGYAEMWGRRLFLPENITYLDKPVGGADRRYDIAFDDERVEFGQINIWVRRLDP